MAINNYSVIYTTKKDVQRKKMIIINSFILTMKQLITTCNFSTFQLGAFPKNYVALYALKNALFTYYVHYVFTSFI
jgi:hypothetical protein